MSGEVCECGAPMVRRMVAAICGPGLPGPVYDLVCSSAEHQEEMRQQDVADQKKRDEDALAKAIADGVILP